MYRLPPIKKNHSKKGGRVKSRNGWAPGKEKGGRVSKKKDKTYGGGGVAPPRFRFYACTTKFSRGGGQLHGEGGGGIGSVRAAIKARMCGGVHGGLKESKYK